MHHPFGAIIVPDQFEYIMRRPMPTVMRRMHPGHLFQFVEVRWGIRSIGVCSVAH
jgi:hypothetical protein